MSAKLLVDDTSVLLDEVVDIRVREAADTVTLIAETRWNGGLWEATATFDPENGAVDVGNAAPVAGDYAAADPMGLFWAADRVGASDAGAETARTTLTLEVGGTEVASERIERTARADGVTDEAVSFDGFESRYYEPAAEGPHPGVLVLGNRPRTVEAALLASRGFATVTVPYGSASPPTDVIEVPLDPFVSAVEWLVDRPTHHDGPVGCLGFSRGGELALLLGVQSPAVGAAVSYSGSAISIGEPLARGRTGPWVRKGETTYFLPATVPSGWLSGMLKRWLRADPVSLRSAYGTALDNHGSAHRSRATIPVERIDGPILLVSGSDDRLWPADELAEFAIGRLEGFDHRHRFEHQVHEGAGHAFRAPYLPTTDRGTVEGPYRRLSFALGGDPAAQAAADADAWPRALDVLQEGLLER